MHYYVIAVNKRLDEWVSEDRLDFSQIELPQKDMKTPLKLVNGSRSTSPDRDAVVSLWVKWQNLFCIFIAKWSLSWTLGCSQNGISTPTTVSVLKKAGGPGRKRKIDESAMPAPPQPPTPAPPTPAAPVATPSSVPPSASTGSSQVRISHILLLALKFLLWMKRCPS